ncbi:hypothetical protein H632_c808p1 [Helicosporidium sp. ATCC 50920]|nr:hypothetical protein H632_c808p1 [Helicosporidium sp. ATCC 50920]|eukprot:KDD75211.1 hypothetical protein H632_c808p1 [Helicosporidium sp. ATCC 50920]
MYMCVLAGFAVADDSESEEVLAAAMRDQGGMAAVLAGIRRCLAFYQSTGSLADANAQSLREMLWKLEGRAGA